MIGFVDNGTVENGKCLFNCDEEKVLYEVFRQCSGSGAPPS